MSADTLPLDLWRSFHFDVSSPPTEPNWLVDGLIARGTITMLSGDTSAVKSFVALALALAMAVLEGGRTWLGREFAGPGRVLIIENEMPAYDVERRLRGLGIRNEHWDRLAYLVKSQAVALDDAEQAQQNAGWSRRSSPWAGRVVPRGALRPGPGQSMGVGMGGSPLCPCGLGGIIGVMTNPARPARPTYVS